MHVYRRRLIFSFNTGAVALSVFQLLLYSGMLVAFHLYFTSASEVNGVLYVCLFAFY